MKTSAAGIKFIEGWEGKATRAYRDSGGVWTIGTGHTSAAGLPAVFGGMVITPEEGDAILATDLAGCEKRVDARYGNQPVAQTVNDGSVSFDFNTGGIPRASWVGKFLAGDLSGARASLMEWVKVGSTTIEGLVNRRKAECALIFDGSYGGAATTDWRATQEKLAALGYYTGSIDEVAGPLTIGAVQNFQRANDLVVDGVVGKATRSTLDRRYAEYQAKQSIATAATSAGAVAATVQTQVAGTGVTTDTIYSGLGTAAVVAAIAVALFLIWHFRGVILGKRT